MVKIHKFRIIRGESVKKTIIGLSLLGALTASAGFTDKQFPIDSKNYRPKVDTGFDQYKSSSLKGTKKIVLTFDDGPHETRTPRLLDILKKNNVKATFFVLTKNINSRTMPIVERILQEGHILSSHDHDHENNNSESADEFRAELSESVSLLKNIERLAGVSQNNAYYRFPYGAYGANSFYHHFNVMKDVSNDLFAENCINFAFWDIDSEDWMQDLSSEQIASNVLAHIVGGKAYKHKAKKSIFGNVKYKIESYNISSPRGGGVVLMHDIHDRSLEAAELIIKKSKQLGIQIVPLDTVKEYAYGAKDCRYLR